MSKIFRQILQNEGPLGFYQGLSASLLRQATYSTTRFGVYEFLKSNFSSEKNHMPVLLAMASVSGFLGGISGNPVDVLNVRMQHDAALPPNQRRNYKNPLDGLIRMTNEEGWKSLFRGVWPNSIRASLMTASQLASYDSLKNIIIANTSLEDSLETHFAASLFAGFVATTVCSPVDVIKTRIMCSAETKSISRFIVDVFRQEGVSWAFRGWLPSFTRLGPHTIATFLFLEQHKNLYRRFKEHSDYTVM
ncbi:Mitochondrial dicarboxylate transporter [Erysiphe necator]|uniref:Putative mitochondrial dicarboxylate carrier n=1 Tax=Uncinula necator TaxID=52586 RepID=A0A0B1P1N8_UNCNE|nr:Mitochondrial dicarboxylate transporter [Erysiphe necator]KHJ30744.1 putative mitochondrial dicarboxylate carrier [Erysiphe necator]